MLMVRPETPADFPAVDRIYQLAFEGSAEMKLVQDLRQSDALILSAVAEDEGVVVGHILYSRGFLHHEDRLIPSAALGPMGVEPNHQWKGIGSQLVAESLGMLRELGELHCFVLGHTWFYPKFGFQPAVSFQIDSVYQAGEHFMGLELVPGSLQGSSGNFVYADAFEGV